jgi:hypothetical protein
MQVIGSSAGLNGRARSIARARQSFIAALPREGRIAKQCRRCFVARDFKPVSMTELRRWAYPGQARQHWHYWSITRALRRLGATTLGRAGKAGVWAINGH